MDDRMLHDPMRLFSSDYDAHNGNILSIDQIDDNSSLSLKRSAPPPSPSFTNGSFMPTPRCQRARLSPARVAIAAAVTIAIADVLPPPPPMIRTHSSPMSVIASVFNSPAPPQSRNRSVLNKRNAAMDGLVPRSGFLRFCRGETYKQNTKHDEVEIEKDLRAKRSAMHFKFRQPSRNTGYDDGADSVGYTLHSSSEVIQDWVMDCNLFDIKSTFERNLSIYPMEQLWVTPEKSKLLLLVSIDVDAFLCSPVHCKSLIV